ncbi:MAG: hypothetical protein QNJ62_12205 [Methyloceanibacter sp.]|nr:hypothetical protein [Methyloceanibacter sp.]
MTKPVDPENLASEDTPIEGTVLTPRQVGMLKVAVVVMGIMLLAGLAALIVGMIYQASKIGNKPSTPISSTPAPATVAAPDPIALEPTKPGAPHALDIPRNANVVSMSLDGHRLALHVRSRDAAEIVIVDLNSGRVVSRLKIEPAPVQ